MRFHLSIILGKSIGKITRALNLGAGAAAPGHFALKLSPGLIPQLIKHIPENIVITGTNGKTTTAKLLDLFAASEGKNVIRNKTGSNLERGIASTLIQGVKLFHLRGVINRHLGIWEVDEAAFNSLAPLINPKIIIFNNLFRDQLDRYGEVDSVLRKWKDTLEKLPKTTVIILNSDDDNILSLKKILPKGAITFGIKNFKFESEALVKIKETLKPDIEAVVSDFGTLDSISFGISFKGEIKKVTLPVPGIYNIYNFLAAFSAGLAIGYSPNKMISSLKNFTPAFGRMEKIIHKGKEIRILLIKNPYGANQVINTLSGKIEKGDSFLMALNDNFADGKDVSWIWDAGFEEFQISNFKFQIICSGTRAEDLALRLKYAGIDKQNIQVQSDIEEAFDNALKNTKDRLFILPTYTALLELQRLFTKRGIKAHYWEED